MELTYLLVGSVKQNDWMVIGDVDMPDSQTVDATSPITRIYVLAGQYRHSQKAMWMANLYMVTDKWWQNGTGAKYEV